MYRISNQLRKNKSLFQKSENMKRHFRDVRITAKDIQRMLNLTSDQVNAN